MNIPLAKPYFSSEEEKNVLKVIRSGWIMQGKKVEELEILLANYIGVKNALLVSSGTAALHLALLSLGIGEGDEVIVPSFSFAATANCILYVGAKPVFVDIEKKTYNIDPLKIKDKISKRTKAIIAVHQIGLMADMPKILNVAKENNLTVIEDAACALGSKYKNKMAGTFGNIACFSFHPRKNITTGEGGLVTTNNKKIAEVLKSLRNHGLAKLGLKDRLLRLGYNYRMTDLQAAIGIAQFKKLKAVFKKRQSMVNIYNKVFTKYSELETPFVPKGYVHRYQSYMIRYKGSQKNRDFIIEKLKKEGIACRDSITAIHKEPLYRKMFPSLRLPETEKAQSQGIILPLYPQMSKKEQEFIIGRLEDVLKIIKKHG